MTRFRRMITHLSCEQNYCTFNSSGVCSLDAPQVILFEDGTFKCEGRVEKEKVELTREELKYLVRLLTARFSHVEQFSFNKGEPDMIWNISRKLGEKLV